MGKEHIRALQGLIKEEWLKVLTSKASLKAAISRLARYKTGQLDKFIRGGNLCLRLIPKYASKILYLGTSHELSGEESIDVTVFFISEPLNISKERTKKESELITKYEGIVKEYGIKTSPPDDWWLEHILNKIKPLDEELRHLKNGHKLLYPIRFRYRLDDFIDDNFMEKEIIIADKDFEV